MSKPLVLLACPFCGCKDIDPEGTACEHEGENGFQATCSECTATGPTARDAFMAAYRWNERR